ncbi:hypothetical protein [Natronorubrum halophilum]|uniref:hypothetical protein n=1 Tax=Natronorubrum halophilum TaxID=1702106 RepID=UPI0013CE6B23|nr:hypothetical protein [Natronorubrum halophilum]
MSREEYIVRASDELKDIIRDQDNEAVEITEGEDRLGEISAKGTENYPILIGAIAAKYIDPNDCPEYVNIEDDYSGDRWERMVHRALMNVIQRLQHKKPNESRSDEGEKTSEVIDVPPVLSELADAVDDTETDSQNSLDQPFVDVSDEVIVDMFDRCLAEISEQIDEAEYNIYFPLNIRKSEQESFLVGGTEICRVDNSTVDQIFESNEIGDISIGTVPLENFLNESKLHPTSYNDNWYWSCSIEAPSSKEAVSNVIEAIEMMIGKINYTIYYDSNLLSEVTLDQLFSSNLLDEEVIVEHPPFILVCEGDKLVTSVSRSDRFGNPVNLGGRFQTTYSDLGFRKFPPSYARLSEKSLASGLQGFFSAVSATNPRDSYFAYWRGLEDISYTDPSEDESADVLKRTGHFCSIENVDTLYHRLKQTRNKLVHSGGSANITVRDTIILREIFLDAFPKIWEIEDSTMDNNTDMGHILNYIINESGIEHTRGTLDQEIKEMRSQIEEYERRKTALSAIEKWQDPQ